jgi:hypothetical protein
MVNWQIKRIPMFFRIRVSLAGSRMRFEGFGESPPIGYYQRLGATAEGPADLHSLVTKFIEADSGGRLLDIDEMEVADLNSGHSDLKDRCGDLTKRGVWYKSGHAFYSDHDGDDREDAPDSASDADSEDAG